MRGGSAEDPPAGGSGVRYIGHQQASQTNPVSPVAANAAGQPSLEMI